MLKSRIFLKTLGCLAEYIIQEERSKFRFMPKSYIACSSDQLFRLVKDCDDGLAFEALYNRYWFGLFVSASKRLRSREDAEEAVQAVFESLWKNRHKIIIRHSLENYLYAAIRYIVLRLIHNRVQRRSLPDGAVTVAGPLDDTTEETILVRDLSSQIEKIVETLPGKCRRVFELSRYEMKTHKEIGAMLGISEKTVENHITKALHVIKTNLNNFFFL